MALNCFILCEKEEAKSKSAGRGNRTNAGLWGKLCFLLHHPGLVVSWDCDRANVYDGPTFQYLVDDVASTTIVFSDTGFEKKDWHPTNLHICKRGEWNVRMLMETALSMLTYIYDFKHSRHKVRQYFKTKLGFTIALFNILVQ